MSRVGGRDQAQGVWSLGLTASELTSGTALCQPSGSNYPQYHVKRTAALNQSLAFLTETRKYITRLQTPATDVQPKRLLRRCVSVAPEEKHRPRVSSDMYTFTYVGEVNGVLGALSTTLPLSRPNTSGMVARPNSPLHTVQPRRPKPHVHVSIQTQTCESRSSLHPHTCPNKTLPTQIPSNSSPSKTPTLSPFERFLAGKGPRKLVTKSRFRRIQY